MGGNVPEFANRLEASKETLKKRKDLISISKFEAKLGNKPQETEPIAKILEKRLKTRREEDVREENNGCACQGNSLKTEEVSVIEK